MHGRLAHEIAGQHAAADAKRDGDRGPGDRQRLIERLKPARDPRIAGLPGVQLRAQHGAIVFIDRRQRSMGRLDAGKKLGAGLAAQDPLQPRLQDLVADLREPRELVEEFFDRHDHGRLLLPLKGRERIFAGTGHRGPGRADRPHDAPADHAIEAVDPPRPGTAIGVPPLLHLFDQHAGGQAGPGDAGHLGCRQCGGRGGELPRRGADLVRVARQALRRIEHARQRPAKGADLDRVEVQRGQFVAEIGGRGRSEGEG